MNAASEQVVITGVGLASSLGLSAEQTWQAVLRKQSGLGTMPALEVPAPPGKGGYQALDLPADFAPDSSRAVRYLRWTIEQALRQAKALGERPYEPVRCGIVMGTTLHGMRSGGAFLRSGDARLLADFTAGSVLQQAAAQIPLLRGEAITTCSACSSSLAAVAMGVSLLESGQLDLVIAGGYDTVSEYAYGGFNSLRLVAEGPLRPFTRNRLGMKLGEGFAAVVLERAADAQRRGATPLAAVLGFGESADAHHLTQPHPQGRGAAGAVQAALEMAETAAEQIDLIAAHATGTPDNDAGEHAALAAVFGSRLAQVPVVAFKSHLGHTLGGAGAVELILSAMALRDGVVPACANIDASEVEFADMAVATGAPRRAELYTSLNVSLGFGGANAAVVLGKIDRPRVRQRQRSHERQAVYISGIGLLLPGMIGLATLQQPRHGGELVVGSGPMAEAEYEHLLSARRVRRLSPYVKMSLAATTLACADAGLGQELGQGWAVLLGSTHGSGNYCNEYYRQIVEGGLIAANPMLFAEGVPNAASAHLSLQLGLTGSCQTIIGTRTAGLDALRLAAMRIASGTWQRAIVGAAEEFIPIANEAYRRFGLYRGEGTEAGDARGFVAGAGAVTFLLESGEVLKARVGRARGRVVAAAGARFVRAAEAASAVASVLDQLHAPPRVLGSANGTWIDRAECIALRRQQRRGRRVEALRLPAQLPELFSVTPLARLAMMLSQPAPAEPISAERFSAAPTELAVICTGYTGTAAGVVAAWEGQRQGMDAKRD